jgi:hypothetical protein
VRSGGFAPSGDQGPGEPPRLPPGGDPEELARLAKRALGLERPAGSRTSDDT